MSALDLQASAYIEFSPFSQQSVNKMSPFSYADKIETPILLIHGEADNNTGTFPNQSKRQCVASFKYFNHCLIVMIQAERGNHLIIY